MKTWLSIRKVLNPGVTNQHQNVSNHECYNKSARGKTLRNRKQGQEVMLLDIWMREKSCQLKKPRMNSERQEIW